MVGETQEKEKAATPESPGGVFSLPVVSQVFDFLSELEIDEVTHLLQKGAYFSLIFRSNPTLGLDRMPTEAPYIPPSSRGFQVDEVPHRFKMAVERRQQSLMGVNRVGDPMANIRFQWLVLPEGHQGHPDRRPPIVPFVPDISQRFELFDAQLRFNDREASGVSLYGTGRTYPVAGAAGRELEVGAVCEVLQGMGCLAGLRGTLVLTGRIRPPHEMMFNILLRIVDPDEMLRTHSAIPPIVGEEEDRLEETFLVFIGEPDPERPTTLRTSPSGQLLGSNVFERIRLVDLDFSPDEKQGFKTRMIKGPIVGSVKAELSFNPLRIPRITPIQTRKGVFEFEDLDGRCIGTIEANMTEGRSIRTSLRGSYLPVFRFGGFGPILRGTGDFLGARGMMSMNSIISVFPRTLSNLYVLRDAGRTFRSRALSAWA